MKSNEESIEEVRNLVEQAERLGVQTLAVPLKDLRTLLLIFHAALPLRNPPSSRGEGMRPRSEGQH
ncbi:hypothetical protein [Caballeronia arvi]|uniref:hypothetical protein n=1 Tax=Caballeronia arvi TaxID=1777135 RepID=UPI00117D7708|nr:hypothetical protein [Caballeronia arvi]